MLKLVPLALAAVLASTGLASAQYSRDYDRGDRYERGGGYGGGYRGGDRDWDRGDYRDGPSWRGPRCRVIITRKVRPSGRIIEERRRVCRR